MILGAHMIIYSRDAEADRAFFRDVLAWPFVDAHEGWLIFRMPPAELAVHPVMEDGEKHEIYLMCSDVQAVVDDLREKGHACSEPADQGFGIMTTLRLPGGSELGLYQPRHASPLIPDAS